MTDLRTTVIAKTDIVGFTPRVAQLSESELSTLLNQHKKFISDIVSKHQGVIIKGEGDAFWIVFPSVTTAALAAIEMHQSLKAMQAGRGDDDLLAIRVAIAVGDVLNQGNDIFGNAVILTARIEAITPPNEIYLSHAAWLVLNKAEVQTSFVNTFTLKGFREPEKIYKIEQKYQTRVVTDQIIVFTDIRAWTPFMKSNTVEDIEGVLLYYDDQVNKVCDEYGGVVRNVTGDGYLLTFSQVHQALTAVEMLCQQWSSMIEHHQIGLGVGIHKGDVNILRSYIYSNDVNATVILTRFNPVICPQKNMCSILISQKVKDEIREPKWKQRFQKVSSARITNDFIEEHGAYQFIVSSASRKPTKGEEK